MLDDLNWDDDHLPLGLRYDGMRKPSQVLDAIYPDLEKVCNDMIEGGHEWMSLQTSLLVARAMTQMAKNEPDLDITFDDEHAEDILDEPDVCALVHFITNLMEMIDDSAPPFTHYGWASEDIEDDGYTALGLWPNWASLEKAVEKDEVLVLDDHDTLLQHHVEMRKEGFMHAVLEAEDGVTTLYCTHSGNPVWSW